MHVRLDVLCIVLINWIFFLSQEAALAVLSSKTMEEALSIFTEVSSHVFFLSCLKFNRFVITTSIKSVVLYLLK